MGNCNYINNIKAYESTYSSFIKSEMQKINVNSGYCANCGKSDNSSGDFTFDEEIGIVRAIERERNSAITDTAITENTAESVNIRNDFCRGGCGFLRCIFCGRRRRRDTDRDVIVENIAKIEEFTDPTNYYRFVNQNFFNNITGKANVDITNLNNNTFERQIQIEKILKKYGRNK